MPGIDLTAAFRDQVRELARVYPPAHKGKARQTEHPAKDGYLDEAYAILTHITNLTNLLSGIRRPYLNVDSGSGFRSETPAARTLDLSGGSPDAWANVRYLTNEERDQIDLQARLIIMRCVERVSQLELVEKARSKNASSTVQSSLIRLLPARLLSPTGPTHHELIAAHRSNITWYLTRRLADVSQSQKEMQEERVKRQLDRARTLGSSGGNPTNPILSASSSTIIGSSSSYTHIPPPITDSDSDDDDDGASIELSQSQILQFEEENANILRAVEDVLQSVQLAESRLLDISALQTELVVQLARQTEVVDNLYDEALISQNEVDAGNVQLRRARERAQSSRKWILLFILLATLALLFLHWYD